MSRNKLIIVILIISLAAILRLFNLGSMPSHLNWDEVSHGYNAYSILKTGKDELGQALPLTAFRAYGDYKLPLYIYTIIPFIQIFNLNEWVVRLPSALAGIGAVVFTFLLVQKLFSNYKLSALSALLLAISPWHLMLSRAAFEANLALFLVIAAVYFFIKGIEKNWFFFPSFFLFGISLYTYNSAKIFVPLIICVLFVLYNNQIIKKFKPFLLGLIIFVILLTPHLLLLKTEEGITRFYWTTILDQGAINQINQQRTSSTLAEPLPKLVNSKPVYFISHFIPNWLSHFSPQYLFFEGGSHYQHSIPGRGMAYPVELLFLAVGIVSVFLVRVKTIFLIFIWFLIAPITAAITRDSPHALRSIFMLPALQIFTALGIVKIGDWFQKFKSPLTIRIYYSLVILILFVFTALFLNQYFGSYRKNYSWSWQYGYKQISEFLVQNKDKYDRIVISKKYGEPHEFLLFHQKIDPKSYQTDPNLIRCQRSNWYWIDKFNGYEFVNDWEVKNLSKNKILPAACPQDIKILKVEKMLLVTSPGNYPAGGELIKTINFLDQKPAFDLVEY